MSHTQKKNVENQSEEECIELKVYSDRNPELYGTHADLSWFRWGR